MKTVTVEYRGWHNRSAEEIAAMKIRLAEVEKERRIAWDEQYALWDRKTKLRIEESTLRRHLDSKVRTARKIEVAFDGIGAPKIVTQEKLGESARARIINRARKQFTL